jgi:hypothetical protein
VAGIPLVDLSEPLSCRIGGDPRLIGATARENRPGDAGELVGKGETDASVCDKVFVKTGSAISFRPDSELYGGGFIIEGNRIRGQSAKCDIKSRKESGMTTHLIASCATEVMFSSVQFSLKTVDENRIIRVFPEMSDMELPYARCPM